MKRLVVGPWFGEFGWELCCWQGYARTLAEKFEEVYCLSRAGHEALYQDFCDRFIAYDPHVGYALNATASNFQYDGFHTKYLTADSYWMQPAAYQCGGFPAWAAEMKFEGQAVGQTFLKYGQRDATKAFDLIVHKRHRQDWKNWPMENVEEVTQHFLSQGLRIACVGSLKESLLIDGCENLRGVALSELADVLASSKLILGSSSGVMHFASLCGCPQAVVTAKGNKIRYETAWNPLQTPVLIINEEGWKASPALVIRRVDEFFSTLI